MPPPADGFVARLVAGPALRAQSDRRLVKLVREGYEAAFEEIVRRYSSPLRRYAAGIVGASAEDVTQDALSKAFFALCREDREIELRPWLYRILRNTALNDLRDRPPKATELSDGIEGVRGVAEEVEGREEIDELIGRLHALPEPQRAAIVMRELEGLGHDEIATALGISGGAARQAIHRARTALRDGLGMVIPLPLLRLMLEGAPAAEIAAGGAGAGVVLKATTATVLVAGTLGAGMALNDGGQDGRRDHAAAGPRERNAAAQETPARVAIASTGPGKPPGTLGGSTKRSGANANRGERRTAAVDGDRRQGGDPPGSDRHGPAGDPQPVHEGPGSGPEADGFDDGAASGGETVSGSDDGSGSNSGPDSGSGEESSSSGSGDLRDSGDDEGFSGQMQPQTQEEP